MFVDIIAGISWVRIFVITVIVVASISIIISLQIWMLIFQTIIQNGNNDSFTSNIGFPYRKNIYVQYLTAVAFCLPYNKLCSKFSKPLHYFLLINQLTHYVSTTVPFFFICNFLVPNKRFFFCDFYFYQIYSIIAN